VLRDDDDDDDDDDGCALYLKLLEQSASVWRIEPSALTSYNETESQSGCGAGLTFFQVA
jgi:hypothetical protein